MFLYTRVSAVRKFFEGVERNFAVRTARRRPVSCHSSSRFWHVGRRIARRNVSCPAALRRDMFMGVSTRATVSSTDSPYET